jgi:hypothetical protein
MPVATVAATQRSSTLNIAFLQESSEPNDRLSRLRAPENALDALSHCASGTYAHIGVTRPPAANAIAEHPIISNRTHVSDLPSVLMQ